MQIHPLNTAVDYPTEIMRLAYAQLYWEPLADLKAAVQETGRASSLLKILALEANATQSPALLLEALTLGERLNNIRVFLDVPLRPLFFKFMRQYQKDQRPIQIVSEAYLKRLLEAMNMQINESRVVIGEMLTQREIEILQLIAQGYSNREIAELLVLSLGTIKRHNSNIYRKLDVKRRTEAVATARDLDLI